LDSAGAEDHEAWSDVEGHIQRYARSGVHPKSVRSILNRLLVKRGYNQQQANLTLVELWSGVEPVQWRGQSQVKGCRRGTLEIKVTNPAILQQLEFSKQKLLKAMATKSPEQKIKNIRFSLN
jgi:hypothetical protein